MSYQRSITFICCLPLLLVAACGSPSVESTVSDHDANPTSLVGTFVASTQRAIGTLTLEADGSAVYDLENPRVPFVDNSDVPFGTHYLSWSVNLNNELIFEHNGFVISRMRVFENGDIIQGFLPPFGYLRRQWTTPWVPSEGALRGLTYRRLVASGPNTSNLAFLPNQQFMMYWGNNRRVYLSGTWDVQNGQPILLGEVCWNDTYGRHERCSKNFPFDFINNGMALVVNEDQPSRNLFELVTD